MTMKSFRDDCILIENSLALWVGGDLEAELRARVDQHLSECERCALEARSLKGARRALISDLRAYDTPAPDLWPSLAESLRREGLVASGRPAMPVAHSPRGTTIRSLESRPRDTRRVVRFGLAAAAAVLFGFLLGRLGGEVVPMDNPHAQVPPSSNSSVGIVQAPIPSHPALPVSDNSQLRHLSPGEPRLSDTAENFGGEWYINPSTFGNSNVGSPASLQSVQPRRW
jgi:anti-sigma factor RsiW